MVRIIITCTQWDITFWRQHKAACLGQWIRILVIRILVQGQNSPPFFVFMVRRVSMFLHLSQKIKIFPTKEYQINFIFISFSTFKSFSYQTTIGVGYTENHDSFSLHREIHSSTQVEQTPRNFFQLFERQKLNKRHKTFLCIVESPSNDKSKQTFLHAFTPLECNVALVLVPPHTLYD